MKLPTESLFILFLILSGNYSGHLLNCHLQRLYKHPIVMHGIAFLTLYFLVISTNKKMNWKEQIKISVLLYIWFILLTKCNPYVTVIILILFCGLRFVTDHPELFKNKETYKKTKKNLNLFCILLTVVGVILYYFDKNKEYKTKFNILDFFVGTPPCKSLK